MSPRADSLGDSVWLRPRRESRGQPALSREQIVGAAVELLDADGLDGLSMRRLGAKLGAGATSVYWHVANKDDLLELAVDEVMGEIVIPEVAEVGWRAAAAAYASGLRLTILRHTWLTSMFGVRPTIGPNAMRLGEQGIAVLTAAGFSGAQVAWASSALASHAIGSATVQAAMGAASTRYGKSPNEMVEEMRPHMDRLIEGHPAYQTWWKATQHLDMDSYPQQSFDFGLDCLLDGLQGWLNRQLSD
jgi:AcrR family transcriptional regulator